MSTSLGDSFDYVFHPQVIYLFISHMNEISIWLIYNLSQMNLHHFNNYIDKRRDYIWHSIYLINALIQFIEGKYGFV